MHQHAISYPQVKTFFVYSTTLESLVLTARDTHAGGGPPGDPQVRVAP
jgi:hypothetical protein